MLLYVKSHKKEKRGYVIMIFGCIFTACYASTMHHSSRCSLDLQSQIPPPSKVTTSVVYSIPADCSLGLTLSSKVSELENITVVGLSSLANVPISYVTVVSLINTCWKGASGRRLSAGSNATANGNVTLFTTITWPAEVVSASGITPGLVGEIIDM